MHPLVDDVTATYLDLADTHAPGLVEGLYLEGSVALDDFRPGASDIDFVTVVAAPLDDTALAALATVHVQLRERHRRPFFDGLYLTWPDLAAGPDAATGGPASHEGRFQPTSEPKHANPVTWHTIAHHGVPVRGPEPADFEIWTDTEVLIRWCDTNLDHYWSSWLGRGERLFSKTGLGLLSDWGTIWTVAGIPRLHYTITTGEITSKVGAARHALHAFPDRWHQLINEALRIRQADPRPSLYSNRFTRRQDILAFGRTAIADAHYLYGKRATTGHPDTSQE